MDLEEALKLLRGQYHDFLNHLQVISGLVELGRTEKVRDYVRRAAEEFGARGRVAKMGIPEVAWALLLLKMNAVPAGLKVSCAVEETTTKVNSPNTGVLSRLHAALISQVSETGEERELAVTGKNVSGGYALTYAADFDWEKIREAVGEIAASELRIDISEKNAVVVFRPGEAR